jgi:hypothetical protein
MSSGINQSDESSLSEQKDSPNFFSKVRRIIKANQPGDGVDKLTLEQMLDDTDLSNSFPEPTYADLPPSFNADREYRLSRQTLLELKT